MKGTSLQHQLQKLLMVANLHQQLRWFNQIILSNSKMVSFTYLARIIFWTAHVYINSSNIIFSNRSNRKQIKWDNHKHYDNGNDDAFIWYILLFNMLRSTLQRFVGNFGQIALSSFQFFEIKLFTYSRIFGNKARPQYSPSYSPSSWLCKKCKSLTNQYREAEGAYIYCHYPRRLQHLTICRWHNKGNTFSLVICHY